MTDQWRCPCGWKGDEPLIHPGMSGGKIVDILDIMCPDPGCKLDPKLTGTREEQDAWWDSWYEKNE